MKKAVWIGIFIFSLALNLAVAATLSRHLWFQNRSSAALETGAPALTRDDVEQIRGLCLKHNGAAMMEARNQIIEKNFQLLDLIAKDPADAAAVELRVNELIDLKHKTEKEAIARISSTMAALPPEKRQAFVVFLKNRSCMMSGMDFGRGGGPGRRRSMGPCPMQLPIEQETSR
jgi:Spy/CpxP family protein refolding chaperone